MAGSCLRDRPSRFSALNLEGRRARAVRRAPSRRSAARPNCRARAVPLAQVLELKSAAKPPHRTAPPASAARQHLPLCSDAAPHRCRASRRNHHGDLSGPAADPLDTDRLMADITRYETFGVHRYGLESADATLDWIAAELTLAGLKVSEQRFRMDRQYVLKIGTLRIGEKLIDVVPQWWPPEDNDQLRSHRADRAEWPGARQPAVRPRRLPERQPSRQARRGLRAEAEGGAARHRPSERRDLHLQRRPGEQTVARAGAAGRAQGHRDAEAGGRSGRVGARRLPPRCMATAWECGRF